MSCGDYMANKESQVHRVIVGSYIRGFASGSNWKRTDRKVVGETLTDNMIALYVEKFCAEHPLSDTSSAAFALTKELSK